MKAIGKTRDIQIISSLETKQFEIVERKGSGHPDTLSDTLGEELSITYSQYTQEKFGAILHHNFDKVGILGGKATVTFNGGKMLSPIRIILNGRASNKFGDTKIPVKEILIDTTKRFFKKRYPMLSIEKDLRIIYEVSTGGSPGAVKEKKSKRHYWFEPRSLDDLPELKFLGCNDTSMGCSYAPYTLLESLVLDIEEFLNSQEYKKDKPWVGNDIKIMAQRFNKDVHLTIAFPQISIYVNNLEEYKDNIQLVVNDIKSLCSEKYPMLNLNLNINTRDKYDTMELYLTFTGSSIENGDEGLVGRGNRLGGLITPTRPYTMEGICGKNPVYHTGKMYSVGAHEIAWDIHNNTNIGCEVYLIGQSGQSLIHPWKILIKLNTNEYSKNNIISIVEDSLDKIPELTHNILNRKYKLS